MAHSSLPIFLDPPNWHQSNQAAAATNDDHQDPRQVPAAFLPPPPPTTGHGGSGGIRPNSMAYRARLAMIPQPEAALKCPRCDSTNTKFCYFNNYSLSQPRHFCKACRRYWTRGGALRNVPVGGGFRKNKKKKKSNNRSKSPTPSQSQLGNSRSIMSRNCNNIESSTTRRDFSSHPSLQLPSTNIIPSLQQQFSRNFGNNFVGIHINNSSAIGAREFEQWQCFQQQQQQPFLVAGLESPTTTTTAAEYPEIDVNNNNFGANSLQAASGLVQYKNNNNCHQQQQQLQNLTQFSRIPLKNEEQNQEQGTMLSNFLRPNDQNNSQFWGSEHQNSWTDHLSALSSSSSSHLL